MATSSKVVLTAFDVSLVSVTVSCKRQRHCVLCNSLAFSFLKFFLAKMKNQQNSIYRVFR